MSDVTKAAVYEALAGDDDLTALLGVDENGNPAIYDSNMNKLVDPAFPCITFREGPGSADGRIRQDTVDYETFDLEVWARDESALTIPQIHNEIDRLLHQQTLTLDTGENLDCVRLSQNPDMYDTELKLHFGLYRYRLVVSR